MKKELANLLINESVDKVHHYLATKFNKIMNEQLERSWRRNNVKFLKEDIDYTDENYLYKPYWYFTKHGIGLGSVPAKMSVWTWFETPKGTYFATSRILSTKELKEFEIVEKQPNLDDIPERSRMGIQDFLEAPITGADMNIINKI